MPAARRHASLARTIRSLREKLGALRTTLTHAGEEQPLHKAALAVVILLDVFILVSIFDGLDVHTRQLASPSERVPPLCREIVIEGAWTPARAAQACPFCGFGQYRTCTRCNGPTHVHARFCKECGTASAS